MASKKTKQELQLEIRLLRQSKILEAVVTIVKHLASCATIVLIAFMVYRCIDCLAGQTTAADIGIKILGDIKLSFIGILETRPSQVLGTVVARSNCDPGRSSGWNLT